MLCKIVMLRNEMKVASHDSNFIPPTNDHHQKFAIAIPSRASSNGHAAQDYEPPLSAPASAARFFSNYLQKQSATEKGDCGNSEQVEALHQYWTTLELRTPAGLRNTTHEHRRKNPNGLTPLEHLLDEYCSLSDFHEYATDIHWHLLRQELKTLPRDSAFMHRQPHIEYTHRRQLVEWLMEVSCYYNLKVDTLQLAVNLLDRYSAEKEISLADYQSLGTMCLWIAAKYEENHGRVPTLQSLITVAKHPWKAATLCRIERQILTVLNFNIGHPFVETFRRFNRVKYNHASIRHGFLSQYLTELLMPEAAWLNYRPSIIAQATMNLASAILNEPLADTYDAATQECVFVIRDLLEKPSGVVYKMYQGQAYQGVSRLAEYWHRTLSQVCTFPESLCNAHLGLLTPLHTPGNSTRSNSISVATISGSPLFVEASSMAASPLSVRGSRKSSLSEAGGGLLPGASTPGFGSYINQRRVSLGYAVDVDMSPLSPRQSNALSPSVVAGDEGLSPADLRYLRRRQVSLAPNHYNLLGSSAGAIASTPLAPGSESACFITPSMAISSRSLSNGLLPSQGMIPGSAGILNGKNAACQSVGLERAHHPSLMNQGMPGFTPQAPVSLDPVQSASKPQRYTASSAVTDGNVAMLSNEVAANCWPMNPGARQSIGTRVNAEFPNVKRSGSVSYYGHLEPFVGLVPSNYPYLTNLVQHPGGSVGVPPSGGVNQQQFVTEFYANKQGGKACAAARPPPASRPAYNVNINSSALYLKQHL